MLHTFRSLPSTVIISVVAGLLILSALMLPWTASGTAAAPAYDVYASTRTIVEGTPTRLVVPSRGIDVSIVSGSYDPNEQTWTLNKSTAQYAASSVLPNDTAGDTFIYGHNNRHVFRDLVGMQPGETAQLHTDNGHVFHYVLRSTVDTTPSDLSAIKATDSPHLTLQTCVGPNYELRRMFYLDFIKVTNG